MSEQVKGIQRYDVVFRVDDEGEGYRKVKDVNGAYVLFKDHEQALAALEARNTELTKPVSDEEWGAAIEVYGAGDGDREPAPHGYAMTRGNIDRMLAARAALKGAS